MFEWFLPDLIFYPQKKIAPPLIIFKKKLVKKVSLGSQKRLLGVSKKL
jgi:hypothetical protein